MGNHSNSSASARVTLAAVAAAAGCSLMTVSRALRGQGVVAEATRQRILQTAKRLGYRPDPEVSRLMGRLRASRLAGAETIAWITAESTRGGWRKSPASSTIFEGAQARARTLGYQLEHFWLLAPGLTPERLGRILRTRAIRGVLVAPLPRSGFRIGPEFGWEHFAAACCGFSLAEPRLHRACSQQYQTLGIAWHELTRRGYTRIGFVLSIESNQRTDGMWLASFLARQHFSPAPASGKASAIVPPLVMDGWEPARLLAWFREHRPDAIIGGGDTAAYLRSHDVRIPGDCAFAHINTIGVPAPAAGVDHHMPELGAAAIDLVIEQLNASHTGLPAIPKMVMVDCAWSDGPDAPAKPGAETP